MEIDKGSYRNIFLMISTAAWKSRRENRSGFSTVTAAPAPAVHNETMEKKRERETHTKDSGLTSNTHIEGAVYDRARSRCERLRAVIDRAYSLLLVRFVSCPREQVAARQPFRNACNSANTSAGAPSCML